MPKQKEREQINGGKISGEEVNVLWTFADLFRGQNPIIADSYKSISTRVPTKEPVVIAIKDYYKCVDFTRKIYFNGKPYWVYLALRRDDQANEEGFSIWELAVATKDSVHHIDLNTFDSTKRGILYDIVNIFREDRIISPEQAHCSKMIVHHNLQELIDNHSWSKISDSISKRPDYASSLFHMPDFEDHYESGFHADFGTLLFQLISFREQHKNDLAPKDLKGLDNLIVRLRKADLLRVHLFEKVSNKELHDKKPILLDGTLEGRVDHRSEQFTVTNTELESENKVIGACIREMRL